MSTIPTNATHALISKHFPNDPMRQVSCRLMESHWRKRKSTWRGRLKDRLVRLLG